MVQCGAICAVFLLKNHKLHCTMRCGALLLAVRCGFAILRAVLVRFYGLYGLCGLVNTPTHDTCMYTS